MATGKVTIAQVNLNQGEFKEVERSFLWFGEAAISDNNGKILTIGAGSDLDVLLGDADSNLKTMLETARANALSDDWMCYVVPLDPDTDSWEDLLDVALEHPNNLDIEGVVVCTPITAKADVEAANTAIYDCLSKYGKFLSAHLACPGIDKLTETWSDYKTRIKAYIDAVAAPRVSVVPQLHGNNLGVVMGRLCNPAVTIADTPMRVATGAVIGLGDDPVDSAGVALTKADIEELSLARFSVPQWHTGLNGVYWADHMMLDNEAGDFQVYENLRVIDYISRRVLVLASKKIADRQFNNLPRSIEENKSYFMRPLREAAKEITIAGTTFPGLLQEPLDGDIQIIWDTLTNVKISITAAPYGCPKRITAYLGLDLSRGLN